jgi:predicted transcriptional regulator
MAPSEVEVDEQLAARAAEVAASRGETIEAVIERALRDYVAAKPSRAR